MGRVARYKKVKAFDKLTPKSTHSGRADQEYIWGTDSGRGKKRNATATQSPQDPKAKRTKKHTEDTGFDLAPDKDDFDLNDILGSVQREKKAALDNELKDKSYIQIPSATQISQTETQPAAIIVHDTVTIGNTVIRCNIPRNDEEEAHVRKRLNINSKTGKSLSKVKGSSEKSIEGRKEGESMRAFERRLKQETRLILLKSTTKLHSNEEKRKRKKEFLKNKKLKKNGGGNVDSIMEHHGVSDRWESQKAGYGISPVSFLNQVERPPTFQMLPRGAQEKHATRVHTAPVGRKPKTKKKEEDKEISILREKFRAQYKELKQKRKTEGNSQFK